MSRRSRTKNASPREVPLPSRPALNALAVLISSLCGHLAHAGDLPVPCGICGANGPTGWVTSGAASAITSGNQLTVNQLSERAVLNWQSFNISADSSVDFRQPDANAVALNRIFQGDPVRILGTLQANGSVYLINQNGILFGAGARVNVGGLVASTLDITPQALDDITRAASSRAPAFRAFVDAAGANASGDVQVEQGAELTAAGRMLLVGSNVTNQGVLNALGGQVILAAGDSVYIAPSVDPNLRGILVDVGQGGAVTNGVDGALSADRGNVTLVGLMVNQLGRVSATTSVRENGSIRLLARDDASINGTGVPVASHGGALQLGAGSATTVELEQNADATAVDATSQARSLVELEGRTISLGSKSSIVAPSGTVQLTARETSSTAVSAFPAEPGEGRIVMAADATIDVSGAVIDRPVSDNVIKVELRGSQLEDSPLQRDGALRGKTVYVDIRKSGTRSDGTTWQGSPIGDLSGDVATMQKTVDERSLTGGSIQLAATGAVLLESGSTLNVSGGAIQYQGGIVNASQVLGADGHLYDIAAADPDRQYVGLANGYTVTHEKWGVTETYLTFLPGPNTHYEAGYVEGKDAGSVTIAAPRVALDGQILGGASAGLHQRDVPTTVASGALYRPFDQLPLAGRLMLGVANGTGTGGYVTPDVEIADGLVLPGAFDPLLDPLPADLDTVRIRPGLFGPDGLGGLSIYANGTVTLPAGTVLNLPVAGQLAVTAGAVDLEGSVAARGGSVSLTAVPTIAVLPGATEDSSGVKLGPGASIDVAGRWVNDAASPLAATEHGAIAIDGGSVTIAAKQGAHLDMQAGSVIDVSAAAHRSQNGTVTAGVGGRVTIGADSVASQPVSIHLGAQLRGYALASGGRLSLTLNSLCLANADCGDDSAGRLWVDLAQYAADGFASFSFASNLGGVEVLPGTLLQPRQVNYMWSADPSRAPSGTPFSMLTTVGVLPDEYRLPVSLALVVNPQITAGQITASNYASIGALRIGSGATVDLGIGGRLSLQSSTSVFIDGALKAPAGDISVSVTTDLALQSFLPAQGLFLEDGARLIANGAVLALRDDLGFLRGSVLDGGSIELSALRGYVNTAPGSVLDVSGTTANLVLGQTPAGTGASAQTVGSAGGAIEISAAEGLILNGQWAAQGGGSAGGGSLQITLDGNLHGSEPSGFTEHIFPFDARELRITSDSGPAVLAAGSSLPASLYGKGLVSADRLMSGGFSAIGLAATNLFDSLGAQGSSVPVSTGLISFGGSVALRAGASLRLNAGRIVGAAGSHVSLAAAYVGLGYDGVLQGDQAGGIASAGTASLNVSADLIDFIGTLGVDGFSTASFASNGDIRLNGVQPFTSTTTNPAPISGVLHSAGSVDFIAQQIYASTLTEFTVLLDGPDHSVLSIHSSPGTPQMPLSAGSQLTLSADEIVQAGFVRAPFGTITMQADRVDLAPGSTTSTSGNGSLIPFGTLQVGIDWTYQLPRGQTAVYTESGPPAQRISLQAADLIVDERSLIDLSGGGDLLGYEFVPGVTGTKDVLANTFSARQFAIVPVLGSKYAPVDPAIDAGFGYSPGASVYLSGYGDLPAGEYAILPARYALLPGSYLVRPVNGYTDIRADEAVRRLDGGVVISGYRTVAGTTIRDSRTSGFELLTSDQVNAMARYDLTSANDFFGSSSGTASTATPRLPRDGGQLQLITTASLDLAGELNAAAAAGRGALVDISASRLLISGGATSTDPTAVLIQTSQLDALGAESVLLGGLRTQTSDGISIDTRASQVTVDGTAALVAPTLTLAARDELRIESGASLRAAGSAAAGGETLLLSGSGAVVQVSTGGQPKLVRSSPTGSGGNLTIDAGASIVSRGSALLEATGTVVAHPNYDLTGGSLAFSVSQLAIGDAPASYPGLALSATELSSLGLADLLLASRSAIEFFGNSELDVVGRLALQASTLTTGTDADVGIHAQTIVLTGGQSATATPVAGNGALRVTADDFAFGGGDLATLGFGTVRLGAMNEVRATTSGTLRSAAALTVETPVITTDSGIDFGITTSQTLQLLGTGAAGSVDRTSTGLGGALSFQGDRVDVATRILAPAGMVSLMATGADSDSLLLHDTASIDVGGRGILFDGQQASADGGWVRMTSAQGGVVVHAGASLDVSRGDGQGDAGKFDVQALQGAISFDGTLLAQGTTAGGQVSFDGYSIPDLTGLNRLLSAAGATGSRVFHQRGPGTLTVVAGDEVRASNVTIEADQGSVIVFGSVDASGPDGGTIRLTARDDVDVYGFLRGDATANGVDGGRMDLWSDQGGVYVRLGGGVSVAGGNGGLGGTIGVRVLRDVLLTAVDADPGNDRVQLGGSISGNRELLVEGYKSYTVANDTLVASNTAASAANPLYAEAADFMLSADALKAALGGGSAEVHVMPGIEVTSSQALTLAADWNLAAWRFGDEPGVLTLRAAGDLNVNRSLSDGFAAVSGSSAFTIPDDPGRSWSYRLVAGADLAASDVLAVGGGAGTVRVAGGTVSTTSAAPVPIMVRTGTGSIDIAAAGDLVLTNRASVIYTAGTNSQEGIALFPLGDALVNYPVDGGDISITVGGDVRGAPTNQLVTGWLWREGQAQTEGQPAPTGWNVNFQRFEQGVGVLAGGDVTIRAGGNIRDLSASIPTIGRQVGAAEFLEGDEVSVVEETGGGHLRVESGGDITGGMYFVGRGDALLRSYGNIGTNTNTGAASALAPTLALGDTQFDVSARGNLTLETVVNPFLIPQATAQSSDSISFFSTYTDQSALRVTSVGGDVDFINTPTRVGGLNGVLTSSIVLGRGTSGFRLYPGTVSAAALSGDFTLGGNLVLWPSQDGNLDIFAGGDIDLTRSVTVADQDPATLMSVAAPTSSLTALTQLSTPLPGIAHVPIHSAAFREDGTGDPEPIRIVAGGDIDGANLAFLAKPVRVVAGGDIVDLSANIQNLADDSVSLISAQGDIRYTTPRDSLTGGILSNAIGVRVDGPGALILQAGGEIDFGTSAGVTSSGNLINPALPSGGADVSLLAGAAFDPLQLSEFEQRYLVEGSNYDTLLADFLHRYLPSTLATKDARIAALRTLNSDLRYQLAQAVLFAEVRAGGRAAANAGPQHDDYSRAFDAIEALFPGSTASDAQAADAGISLFFSRIYTLDNGSISLVAPRGDVNVGLSTPPAAFGVSKPASELGIVVQRSGNVDSLSYGDFLVNESRVFAAGGGDILVWSTQGDIDAGRGAKTAIAAPAPTITFDTQGNVQTVFPAVLTGSGIQALSTNDDVPAGSVDLFAPRGVVNAGDAGIVAGNLTIGATAVLGADNISVSGVSVGVPADTGGFGAAVTGVSAVASSAANAAQDTVAPSRQAEQTTPLADQALGFLDVFITGFGDQCDPAKESCEQR